MKDTKLVQTLLQLDKAERNKFKKFLISPYFNNDDNIVAIYDILEGNISNQKEEFPEKTILWKRIFKGIAYDDIRLRKYFSDLLKLLSQFLSLDLYQNDPIHQDLNLLEVINNKKLNALANNSLKNARVHLATKSLQNAQTFLQSYHLERKYYEILNVEDNRKIRSNLEDINRNLDIFYLSEKLRLFCMGIALQTISAHAYKLSYQEEILSMVEKKGFENVPSVMVYAKLLRLFTNPSDENNYFSLRQLVSENNLLFPTNELTEIYSIIINYATIQINTGNNKFLEDLFEFYREVVSQNILLEANSFSPWHFRNIVVIGLRLKEFSWIEQFIHAYSPLLPESQRENSLTFNLASLYFYQKKYDLVIKTLQSVEYDDYTYNLNSKTILICTYYDTGETDALFFLLDSFRAFLNRNNNIPEDRKNLYRNFISFSKKIAKLAPKDEKSKQKLILALEQTKNVASKSWLLEKLAEL
jgi:hypothetical protein